MRYGGQRSKTPSSGAPERQPVIHSSLYLPEPVYEALRKVAFDERAKIHDLAMEGIVRVSTPSFASLKPQAWRSMWG